MHIPDGLLSPVVWAPLNILGGVAVYRVSQTPKDAGVQNLAHMGCLGAFVFAAQMINFPVGPGVSAHLIGISLLNTLLGPRKALLLMTAILAVQALMFQDGGVLAFGANLLNLGITGVFASELCLRAFRSNRKLACFAGGAASVVAGYGFLLAEMALSGLKLSPMIWTGLTGFMLVSAFAEGMITVAVVSMLGRTQPNLQRAIQPQRDKVATASLWLGVAALTLAAVGAIWASPLPDLLEFGVESNGFSDRAFSLFSTAWADYEWRGVDSSWLRKALAGLLGVGAVFLLSLLISRRSARPDGARS